MTIRSSGARSATGPDLARVGGKYSDDWHRDHLTIRARWCPARSCRTTRCSFTTDLDYAHIAENLKVQAELGVPYTREMIDMRQPDVRTQASNDSPGRGRIWPSAIRKRRRAISPAIRAHHRSRCADCLSANARYAGRLQALQRQSQHPVRRRSCRRPIKPFADFAQTWGLIYFFVIFLWCWPMRCGRRARSNSMNAARMPLRED